MINILWTKFWQKSIDSFISRGIILKHFVLKPFYITSGDFSQFFIYPKLLRLFRVTFIENQLPHTDKNKNHRTLRF